MFESRQYQIDAVDYVLQSQGRPILCAPTGSGKTVIAAMAAKQTLDAGGSFGILTPREEILIQVRDTMREVCGWQNVGVLKAGHEWNPRARCQVISWPTLLSRTARDELWFPQVDRLAVDECHLAVSPKMAERVLPHYQNNATALFGLTATPARKSGRGLGSFFTNIKHVTSVRQLIKDKKLCPLEYWAGSLPDVTGVKTTGGDFNSKQLRERTAPLVGDIIDNWCRLARARHTIVFAVDVPHCEALAERFQMAGIKAAPLHVHMTPDKRHQVVEAFKAGDLQVLVNVTIASYGFDAPTVDCIVLARPTKSIVLHLQMLGRGMRVSPGKEVCMVLDHADNVRRLGQADDLYRWRLSKGKAAAGNWSRDKRSEGDTEDAELHECGECHHMFGRSRECPKCGWEIPMPKRDIQSIDADLVPIGASDAPVRPNDWPDDETFYRMLQGIVLQRGYSVKWAACTFKDCTGAWPPWGFEKLGPLNPNTRVRNWVTQRLRSYAREKKKAAQG